MFSYCLVLEDGNQTRAIVAGTLAELPLATLALEIGVWVCMCRNEITYTHSVSQSFNHSIVSSFTLRQAQTQYIVLILSCHLIHRIEWLNKFIITERSINSMRFVRITNCKRNELVLRGFLFCFSVSAKSKNNLSNSFHLAIDSMHHVKAEHCKDDDDDDLGDDDRKAEQLHMMNHPNLNHLGHHHQHGPYQHHHHHHAAMMNAYPHGAALKEGSYFTFDVVSCLLTPSIAVNCVPFQQKCYRIQKTKRAATVAYHFQHQSRRSGVWPTQPLAKHHLH